MKFIKLLLVAALASLITGQLIRMPLSSSSGAVTVTDFLVLTVDAVFLIYAFSLKKALNLPPKITLPAALFMLAATSSLVLAANNFSFGEIIVSSLFLVRFVIYFFLFVVFFNIVRKKEIASWINIMLVISIIFITFGFIQLLVFPDFSSLTQFGWDPHVKRITSTLLDPNFSGAVFVIICAFSISMYLFLKKKIYLATFLISFLALMLTFSRSSYLTFLAVILTIGLLRSPKMLFAVLTIFIFVLLSFSQFRSRVIGAFTLDETAQARIESWRNAIVIFKDHPFFGVGFNTYRFAQAQYGLFSFDQPEGGHSGAGVDSSLLLVAATTGVFGLGLFLFLIVSVLTTFAKNAKSNYLSLGSLASFFGLLVHSQFVNSLFFPQIMLLLFFMLGLVIRNDT